MKATEQYFPVVRFITLYKMALSFESTDEILMIRMKATEQYFPVVQLLNLNFDVFNRRFRANLRISSAV